MLLAHAQLYLCTDARRDRGDFAAFVDAAFSGGVDIIQLRDKRLEAAEELEFLSILRAIAERHDRLWSVNDRADIAATAASPVLHLGQGDLPRPSARRIVGDTVALGLSTHDTAQLHAARAEADLGYFCVGPVWATPTKPGRPGVGLDLVRAAAEADRRDGAVRPWFAIGGIDHDTVDEVVDAGAQRIVVVRAITEADDPAESARRLRARLPEIV
ncbi:thiamine phosphate synthase [Microbacterium sp. GXF0217]